MQITQYIDRTPQDYDRLTVTTGTVVRLTEAKHILAKAVFVTIEDNSIKYRIDSGDPSAVDGHAVIATGNMYFVDPKSIKELRMIGISGTAIVIVTYYI